MSKNQNEDLLVVQDLVKYFPVRSGLLQRVVAWVQAVDKVNFTVKRGETLVIMSGLSREDLIHTFAYGSLATLEKSFRRAPNFEGINSDGLIVSLHSLGAELYHWAHGRSDFRDINVFLNPNVNFERLENLKIPQEEIRCLPSGLPEG